jgi:hypothetical protein
MLGRTLRRKLNCIEENKIPFRETLYQVGEKAVQKFVILLLVNTLFDIIIEMKNK